MEKSVYEIESCNNHRVICEFRKSIKYSSIVRFDVESNYLKPTQQTIIRIIE